ncbi:MAG: iron-sulfur cluster carrier protein ApbC [Pseudomonadota bacterium]|nr:iron-sulfur cluster carrier protein ApbC [Pseudomonadota bacterium]
MTSNLKNLLNQALSNTKLKLTGQTLEAAGAKVQINGDSKANVYLKLGFPLLESSELAQELSAKLSDISLADISVQIDCQIQRHAVQGSLSPTDSVANIIAVSSAKGGVGKSTVAVNLALALIQQGSRVGILDADIYGPSQPIMLGVEGEQPVSHDGKTMEPISAHGLSMMSIGCLIDTQQPTVWRGPMVTQALNQLMFQTNWPNLDYLIVDMPPGTGDIQLTLSQKFPVSGALIVTTPQDIALADAIRGLRMFEKVHIPVLGLIENMSTFNCPNCGESTSLFGHGGGVEVARKNQLKLLGQLPLDIDIRQEADNGKPIVISKPDSKNAKLFRDISLAAAIELSLRSKDYSHALGKINVEKGIPKK